MDARRGSGSRVPSEGPFPVADAGEEVRVPALKGQAAPAYGQGRSTSMRSGYVRVRWPDHPLAMKDGYVFEHRLVLYQAGILR